MRRLFPLVLTSAMLLPVAATAHHKEGHKLAVPGAPLARFILFQIDAGATCTAPIQEPEGADALPHGGPPKLRFVSEEELELVEISPNVVQFCFMDGEPRARDLKVRVSFVPGDEEEEVAEEE